MTTSTEYTATPPQPPPPPAPVPPRPPLRRSQSDKAIAGVAAGLAHWLGIDPVIVRVVFVVLAVFGGSGLVLYAIGWLFIPMEGAEESSADTFFRDARQPGTTARTVLVIVGVVVAVTLAINLVGWALGDWSGFGTIVVLAIVGGLILYVVNRQQPTAMLPPGSPVVSASVAPPQATTSPMPAVARERSYLGLIVLSTAVLVSGLLITLEVTGVIDLAPVVIPAVALGILGLGILTATWVGRATWLLWFAIPLILVTMVASVAPANAPDIRASITGGVGERVWIPTSVDEAQQGFQLGVGSAELDLTQLTIPPGITTVPVTAGVGMGDLLVTVPADARVLLDADVQVGELVVDGVQLSTGDPSPSFQGTLPGGSDLGPVIDLTLTTGLGNLEVSRA